MGSHFHLVARLRRLAAPSRSERVKRKAYLRASAGKLVLGRKALSYSLIAMVAMMAFAYMALINIRVTKGFEIKDLEVRLTELQKSQRLLERQAAELQSIQNIEQKVNMSNFVPTTNVSYLKPVDYAINSQAQSTP